MRRSTGQYTDQKSQQLIINKAPLTITADDQTKPYGSPNPAFTFSYTSFVNSDTRASLTAPSLASTLASATSAPGTYAITPAGAVSNNYAITYVPGTLTVTNTPAANNYQIAINSVTCKGSANGSISINAAQNLNYIAAITGNGINATYPFTTSTVINSLSAGSYNLCFSIAGQSMYSQCFTVVITEPKDLSVYSTVSPDHQNVNLSLKGGTVYNIQLNGVFTTTTDSVLTLPLMLGNNQLIVTTNKLCQGVVEESIPVSDRVIPYPNPFINILSLNMGYGKTSRATIEIYTTNGTLVYKTQCNNPTETIRLDVSAIKNTGVYSLKLITDSSIRLFKIIRQ